MKVLIEIIDAEPAELERIDNGNVEDFKKFKIKNNKTPFNRNVRILADGYSKVLDILIEDSYVTTEHSCIERGEVSSYSTDLVINSDSSDDYDELKKRVWDIVAAFSGVVTKILESREYALFPLESPKLDDENDQNILIKACESFIVNNKSKTFSRNVCVRASKSMRMLVGGEWVVAALGTRVPRVHLPVSGIVSNLDFLNRSITVRTISPLKKVEIKFDNSFLQKMSIFEKMFKYQSFKFDVVDHYLESKNDSELHFLDMTLD